MISPPVPRGIVPVTYVHLLYEYLARMGLDAEGLLGAPKPAVDRGGPGRYDVQAWGALLAKAAQRLKDPLLGLHLGSTITPRHLGMLGYVLLACGDLGAALARFEQYQRLLYDVNPLRLIASPEEVVFEWGVEQGRPGPLVDECAVTALVQFSRDLVQGGLGLRYVSFVNPVPADLQPYLDYFDCPVLFDQPSTRIAMPITALQHPLRSPDPALLEMLSQQADALLAELGPRDDLQRQLDLCLTQMLLSGEPSLAQAALALHISPRTLHRRLAAQGLQFRGVLEALRLRLARQYLQDQRLQLAEIAGLLGYSEQSAFTRAFRRWTQSSPLAFRRAAQQAAAVSGRVHLPSP
nr:AraC family transcriptional regulator [uncultured Roseateles sp.]